MTRRVGSGPCALVTAMGSSVSCSWVRRAARCTTLAPGLGPGAHPTGPGPVREEVTSAMTDDNALVTIREMLNALCRTRTDRAIIEDLERRLTEAGVDLDELGAARGPSHG